MPGDGIAATLSACRTPVHAGVSPYRGSTSADALSALAQREVVSKPSWLILILVGVAHVILGVATPIGQFLIWIGVAVLVVSLILGLVGRGRSRI